MAAAEFDGNSRYSMELVDVVRIGQTRVQVGSTAEPRTAGHPEYSGIQVHRRRVGIPQMSCQRNS